MGLLDYLYGRRDTGQPLLDQSGVDSVGNPLFVDSATSVEGKRQALEAAAFAAERGQRFVQGGPAPMEPDLQATQTGAQTEAGQTRRPGVLPITRDAQTGELQFAMPRLLDILNNGLPSAAGSGIAPAAVRAGETLLGAGPVRKAAEEAGSAVQPLLRGPIRAYHGSPHDFDRKARKKSED